MRIIRLTAENFKKLIAVEIEPNGTLQIISGVNEAGKSSCMDAIASALGGARAAPEEPIRRGEDYARVILDLGDLIVRRHWSRGGSSSLTVEDAEGNPKRSPQNLLDRLFGAIALDPMMFARMPAREQAEALRRVAGLDFSDLDAERATLYEERTAVNREFKQAEARIEECGPQDGDIGEEVSITEIARRLDDATRQVNANDTARRTLLDARKRFDDERRRINEINVQIEALVRRRDRHQASADLEAIAVDEYLMAVEGIVEPDVASIRRELAEAEGRNKAVHAASRRRELVAQAESAQMESRRLTESIASVDAEKEARLSAARFPVPGLSLNGDTVIYDGVPFGQASTARQIRVGLAVAAALDPKLRVCLVRDGSALDARSLAEVAAWAQENSMQVIMERVSGEGPSGVVISDGRVAATVEPNPF